MQESSSKHTNPVIKFIMEMYFLLTNWKFIVPFALNQIGSVLYVRLLGTSDISMALPICNSLTFLFTAATSSFLGEKALTKRTVAGMALILLGIGICVYSKLPSGS